MDNMIGQRIKNRRKELHITQTQIQEQTSVTSGNLSCIENGKYLPSAMALVELSRVLNCSIDWILTGKSKITNNSDSLDILESKDELTLIHLFRDLSEYDQEDLLMIAEMKANKRKNTDSESSHSIKNKTTTEIA